jgi:hypothetical protein
VPKQSHTLGIATPLARNDNEKGRNDNKKVRNAVIKGSLLLGIGI